MRKFTLSSTLLVAVVAFLTLGEGYLLWQNLQLRSAVAQNSAPAGAQAAGAPIQAPTTVLVPLNGTIGNITGNTLTLQQGSTSVDVVTGSGTTIVQEGPLKDDATYQADLEVFHEDSDQLMQNPQANQAELETLIAPSRYVETPVSLSQLATGEQLLVFADGQSSGGAYDAYRIVVFDNNNEH